MINRMTVLGLALTFSAVAAANQTSTGKISIVGKQMGAPVEGEFKKFTAQVQFDPANPTAGKANIEVDVASVDIGLEDFNQELRSKTWFDAKGHPKASFVSSSIKPAGNGRFEANGKLTIKGKTQDITVPVTVKTEGGTRVFEGVLPIKRTAFNVGEGEWKDTSIVADDVQVRFRVQSAAK
jgi:polyisoprenoid-binding protein YceI